MHLLVVEDDPQLGALLRRLLGRNRHLVELATTAAEALETVATADGLDLIVLDIGLPDRSGLEVARRLQSTGSVVPILMLTARDAVDDRVAGLDAGADDYLVKPFAFEELAARIRAVARRRSAAAGTTLRCGPIALDERRRTVSVDDRSVELTARELALLECLMRHRGQALSRDQLLDHAWPYGSAVTLNSVDAYIHHLRTKLGAHGHLIRTVRGIGYRLAAR